MCNLLRYYHIRALQHILYFLQVVLLAPDDVAEKAVILLKDIFTNLGPRLQQNQVDIHEDFIGSCIDRLKALFDTVSVLEKDRDSTNRVIQETVRMVRILTVLKEYVAECDEAYGEERVILPLSRCGMKTWKITYCVLLVVFNPFSPYTLQQEMNLP